MPSSNTVAPPNAEAAAEAVNLWRNIDPHFAAALDSGLAPAQALTAYGLRLCRRQQAAEAARVFHAALAFHPRDTLLWNNRAVALERAGALGDARACLEQSLALVPAQHDTWLLLGGIRRKTGDLPGAQAAYRAALDLDVQSFLAWECLAIIRQEAHDYPGAIDCFQACIRCGGATAPIQANLGKLCFQVGRFAEAARAYAAASDGDPGNPNYSRMLRKTRFLLDLIGGQAVDAALDVFFADRRAGDRPAGEIRDLLKDAFSLLSGFQHAQAAAAIARKRVALSPGDASAEYLLQAANAGLQPSVDGAGPAHVDRAPPRYIVETFDRYADFFEQQLVNVLGYDVPEKLCAALHAVTDPGRLYCTLDAGCGTGLCAPLLRPISRTLVGVDLAPKMLEQAARRQAYDRLVCADLVGFLERAPMAFDLIIAADVLIYFGDLAPLFDAAAQALVPGGFFACSTESLDAGRYRLLPTGRFAHTPAYVRAGAAAGFEECSCAPTTIRQEAAHRVAGHLFIFRRRPPDPRLPPP